VRLEADLSSSPPPADIIIAGAGAAGLSAAIALADAGFSVVCIGRFDLEARGRTVALFEGSLRFYRALGLWPQLADLASPIETISMIDDTGAAFRAPTVTFSASEIGLPAFGANIENNRLVETLAAIAQPRPGLTLHQALLTDIVFEKDRVRVVTDSGAQYEAKLLIAADGRRSLGRGKAGIGARSWTYPQVALTVLLAHDQPHRQISTEFHTRSGPCTLVPLPARGDAPYRSSLVWLMSAGDAKRRAALSPEALAAEIEQQVHAYLGAMRLDGPPGFFPMTGLRVSRLAGHRIALIGEAAHVFPPLAAQGLNLGLRDTASLVEILEDARNSGRDIGAAATLASYSLERRSDISVRTHGIDILNRSLLTDLIPIHFLRSAGLLAFSMVGPLRRAIMREGILPHGHVPRLMRAQPLGPKKLNDPALRRNRPKRNQPPRLT
jgi:2-octaprenyl-6-methoxyphenol hydroxylase